MNMNERINNAYKNNLGLINQPENSIYRTYHVLTTNGKFNPIENIIIYDENGQEYNIGKYFENTFGRYNHKDLNNIIVQEIARRNALKKDKQENFVYKDTLYLFNGKGVTINQVMENVLDFTTETAEHYRSYIVLDFETPFNIKGLDGEHTQGKFFLSGSAYSKNTSFGDKVDQLQKQFEAENIKIDKYTIEKMLTKFDITKKEI